MPLILRSAVCCTLVFLSSGLGLRSAPAIAAQKLLIPLTAPDLQTADATAEALNAQGVAKANQGDFKGAIAAFTQALQLDAKFDAAYNNRGFARYKLGNFQGAFDDLNRAIYLNPNDALSFYNRGIVRYQLKTFSSAINDFTESLKRDAMNPLAYYSRAVTWMRLKDYKNAALDLQAAAELHRQQGNQQGYERALSLIKKLETNVN